MNKWLRKSFVVMVSLLTFGLVTPTQFINEVNAEKPTDRGSFNTGSLGSFGQRDEFLHQIDFNKEEFLENLIMKAEAQSYQKFGLKIKPVIENEFREIIFPNIQLAIEETAALFPEEDLMNLVITETPGKGQSEKIFNIRNSELNKDVLRFHVRRDNPPQAGYWFNFHFHTYHDSFQSHHDLGSIYWDKNTPPKWMS
jgi:hypothetical protein